MKTKESKIVHHDRLSPAKELLNSPKRRNNENAIPADKIRSDYSDGERSGDSSSYTHGHNDSDFETDNSHTSDSEYETENGGRGDVSPRRYPERNRNQRLIPNIIPWSALQLFPI